MSPDDARSALHDIRRLQGAIVDGHLRHSFTPRHLLPGMAAALLLFTSFDLQGGWGIAARTAACVVFAVTLALVVTPPVQRDVTRADLVLALSWVAGVLGGFVAFRVITVALGLPFPATVAALATIVAGLAAYPAIRRARRRRCHRELRARPANAFFDEILHAPARLPILASLTAATGVEAGFLRDLVGIDDAGLRRELSFLFQAGYVRVHERQGLHHSHTYVQLTPWGRHSFACHVAALEDLVTVAAPHGGSRQGPPASSKAAPAA
ncbi:transcriptional regulator [Nonomuraea bangladeshensis]|uniref:transcriptional regulator n=1 Tax=Nonomuraea bangladeshensis TaxID=404385 RepID=UPI003C2C06FD